MALSWLEKKAKYYSIPGWLEKKAEYNRLYYLKNRLKLNAYQRARYASAPGKKSNRAYSIRKKFGITFEDAETLLWAQGGECANERCRKPLTFPDKHTHIDHNHKTGRVRGILCRACNLILGHAKDNPALLLGLSEYL